LQQFFEKNISITFLFEPSCLNLRFKFIEISVNNWHRLFSPARIKNTFLIFKIYIENELIRNPIRVLRSLRRSEFGIVAHKVTNRFFRFNRIAIVFRT